MYFQCLCYKCGKPLNLDDGMYKKVRGYKLPLAMHKDCKKAAKEAKEAETHRVTITSSTFPKDKEGWQVYVQSVNK